MATPRTIRRFAFQALYQLDAVPDAEIEQVRASIDSADDLKPAEIDKALNLARDAFDQRAGADAAISELAPEWPMHRQPAVDRALLRLAYHEMTSGTTPPKAAVSEAVKLAKEFSTEKSPAFVNAILDKLLKKVLEDAPVPAEADETSAQAEEG